MALEDRYEKAARNQSLFRDVNERIGQLSPERTMEIICECCDLTCVEPISITHEEYETIRQDSNRFPVKPGHEDYDIERVADRHPAYLVVEKLSTGGRVAEALDPRV